MARQTTFANLDRYNRRKAGGTRSHEKFARPLCSTSPIHLILKSDLARDSRSFRQDAHRGWLDHMLNEKAKKFGLQLLDYANVGTHLHLKLKTPNRTLFKSYLRTVTGFIALRIGQRGESFWTQSPFTRVLDSSYEDLQLKVYFQANRVEAESGYGAREEFRLRSNAWVRGLKKRGAGS